MTRQLPTITGRVSLDLTCPSDRTRYALWHALELLPTGSRVVLRVPDWPTDDVLHFLADLVVANALQIEIEGEADAVAAWVTPLRRLVADRLEHPYAAEPDGPFRARRRLQVVSPA